MKKKLLIVSLFAMLFCLTACSKEVVMPDGFDANLYGNAAAEITAGALQLDTQALTIFSHDAEDYVSYEDIGYDVEVYKSICSGTLTAREEAGDPIQIIDDIQFAVSGIHKDIVTVTVPVEFTDYTVNYDFTFEPNPKAEYNPYVNAYNLTEITVSTQHTMGELLAEAGMNTVMGVGIVFLALVFISFIISLFKYLPGSGAKKQPKKEETKKPAVPAPPAPVVAASNDLMNDKELVAVITAAVMAASEGSSTMVSSDKLVVRSIKRVSR